MFVLINVRFRMPCEINRNIITDMTLNSLAKHPTQLQLALTSLLINWNTVRMTVFNAFQGER